MAFQNQADARLKADAAIGQDRVFVNMVKPEKWAQINRSADFSGCGCVYSLVEFNIIDTRASCGAFWARATGTLFFRNVRVAMPLWIRG
jgi:hypothetical protein